MNELQTLQLEFQAHLLEKNNVIFKNIKEPIDDSKKNRMLIYCQGYYLRLIDVLKDDYPILNDFMGEKAFITLCETYINQYPSISNTLFSFGANLCELLIDDDISNELAKFEWLLAQVSINSQSPLLTEAHLKAYPLETWPDLTFEFQHNMTLLPLKNNIPLLWENDGKLENLTIDDNVNVMVWQKEHSAYYFVLDAKQKYIQEEIKNNVSFSNICEGLCSFMPDVETATYLISTIKEWVNDELFIEKNLKRTPA